MMRFIFLFTLMFFIGVSIGLSQISVIVSKSSTNTANKSEVKEIFSANKLAWENGKPIQVVDQFESEVGKKFYESFLGVPVSKVRLQWTKLVMSGQSSAPVKCSDDEAVKKAIADKPNAVGYISSSSLDGTVKEIVQIK